MPDVGVVLNLGSLNGNWVGIGEVPASLGVFMDVDDGSQSVSVTFERPSTRTAIIAASTRSSNGITINEPNLCRGRSLVAVDVAGKGKRKVGDVPTSLDNGSVHSFFVLRCAYVY